MRKLIKNIYLEPLLFYIIGAIVALFLLAYIFPILFYLPQLLTIALVVLVLMDVFILFRAKKGIFAQRIKADKLSNGDDNDIKINVENFYRFGIKCNIIDEIPHQFQNRDINFNLQLDSLENKTLNYQLRPVKRGVYHFGSINIYVRGFVGLISRKFVFDADSEAPVYPSYIQMRKYEMLAFVSQNTETGFKKMRKLGQSSEFEQIKEYVQGDDYRNINWKATARKNDLMVNQYIEERSQNIYNIIDKGRIMKSPFEGLSLLDYAINASLVLSNIILKKDDKAGLITFSHQMGNIVPANSKSGQMQVILETLYNQKTHYLETNFELLYATLRRKITTRSLLVLYTNFDSLSSLKRQLPYLRLINKRHLLVVVFFENTELEEISNADIKSVEDVYVKTIAEKFSFEKRQIVKELSNYGIHTILTAPKNLTINTINKYLELKGRNLI